MKIMAKLNERAVYQAGKINEGAADIYIVGIIA